MTVFLQPLMSGHCVTIKSTIQRYVRARTILYYTHIECDFVFNLFFCFSFLFFIPSDRVSVHIMLEITMNERMGKVARALNKTKTNKKKEKKT